ncbi:hypothetical protein BpHYR1_052154 [Brachionus plicatilis]|uniref:Uncharacterized protein n=1 Tax=Brachionus plicatilis TaxID=10195 RepID=A0A3M7R5E7_BRAPC|nr:hypothetical protein BpHYR1_052154 [Brachionus plicatilis]
MSDQYIKSIEDFKKLYTNHNFIKYLTTFKKCFDRLKVVIMQIISDYYCYFQILKCGSFDFLLLGLLEVDKWSLAESSVLSKLARTSPSRFD